LGAEAVIRHGQAQKVCAMAGPKLDPYNSRRAAYDLAKIRSKSIVERIGRSRRYRATADGVKKLAYHPLGESYQVIDGWSQSSSLREAQNDSSSRPALRESA